MRLRAVWGIRTKMGDGNTVWDAKVIGKITMKRDTIMKIVENGT